MSGLYFRGKLAYVRAFAPAGGALVITPSGGLCPPDTRVDLARLAEWADVGISAAEPRYREPLVRDARALAERLPRRAEVVLLGSVATGKYVEPLLEALGSRLVFPRDFVGRGDMSRGGLMLRCVREQIQLTYIPVAGAVRNGARPAKLPKIANIPKTSGKRNSLAG